MVASDMWIPYPLPRPLKNKQYPLRRLVAYRTNEKYKPTETQISIFIAQIAYVSAGGIVFGLLVLCEQDIMNLNLNTKWISI